MFSCLAPQLKAQAHLVIVPDSLNFVSPQPASFGGSVTYRFQVVNIGNADFNDSIKIRASVNGGPSFLLADSAGYFLPAFTGFANFVVDDSVSIARYGGGVNIVVIWPTSPNLPDLDVDSISDTVFVTPMALEDGLLSQAQILAYPNPTTGELHFIARGQLPRMSGAHVFGVDGKLLRSYEAMPQSVDLSEFPAGLYFVRLECHNGEKALFKIMKE